MRARRHVLIVSHALELGGAERALLGLLSAFDPQRYDVDLFLLRHRGELLPYIPDSIHLLPEIKSYTCLAEPIASTLCKKAWSVALGRAVGKFRAKQYLKAHPSELDQGVTLEYSHKYTLPFMPQISNEAYDLAISFLTPHYFVASKVKAMQKIAWIHTDYAALQIDTVSELKMWSSYDKIVSISDSCTDGFLQKFPTLANRIIRMDHILSPHLIHQQAVEFQPTEMAGDEIKLLSIGRFCTAKNFDNVPDICHKILENGLKIHWYLIGFGGDEELIRSKISEAHMENHVTMLGKKSNPYPYIQACDLYVQPSRYEGNCVSVHEAQILGKPVVITDYATSRSQLENGVDGIIVPTDNQGCAAGIAALLRDKQKLRNLQSTCAQRDYSNHQEVTKLYTLMEG